jgi:WD40 repeat protein
VERYQCQENRHLDKAQGKDHGMSSLFSLQHLTFYQQQVAYTRDGAYVVSGSTDNMVILWDARTKEEACSFACLRRITALDTGPLLTLAVGDGAGVFYILHPIGLLRHDKVTDSDDAKNNA